MSILTRTNGVNSHVNQNILKSLFQRIDNTFVEKKRSLMKDGNFNRSFTCVDMKKDGNRLETYIRREWQGAVSMSDMSSAGFCFTGVKDTVVCFSCKGVLSSWEAGQIPIKRHIKAFPFCKFAKKIVKNGPSNEKKLQFDDVVTQPAVDGSFEDEIVDTIPFFSTEYNRLLSFLAWPNNNFVKSQELAKAGFYLKGAVIKCFACFAEVKDLNDEDRAMEIHLKESPDCPFIKGLFTGNKEITPEELNRATIISMRLGKQSRLITPFHPVKATPSSEGNLPSEIARSDGDNPMYLKAEHEDYFREKQRLESFVNWPKDHFLQPVVFAKADFFKSDTSDEGDKVTCFYCVVNPEEWEEGDDPQNEHYVNFPNCKWLETELSMKRVKEMKGEKDSSQDSATSSPSSSAITPAFASTSASTSTSTTSAETGSLVALQQQVNLLQSQVETLATQPSSLQRATEIRQLKFQEELLKLEKTKVDLQRQALEVQSKMLTALESLGVQALLNTMSEHLL